METEVRWKNKKYRKIKSSSLIQNQKGNSGICFLQNIGCAKTLLKIKIKESCYGNQLQYRETIEY